ncbi:hypothetical protein HMN09_01267000 [Mycena chlorophos]|uniref:F-box domain-containing protein n=1 Tax=Mycena chlorophos TaxID=658473 RepID=A0A8H6S1B6_MYCCL|nr:hypothetical protein HMN09_01267000 [Mycena chlorophos]
MQLQDLPPELLTHIFSFACTDTGATGRSLSQVSRYIRNTSATVKLQSVALLGRQQFLKFATFLTSNDMSNIPYTRYLYIGGQESESELNEILSAKREGYAAANAKAIAFAKANPGRKHAQQLQLLRDEAQLILDASGSAMRLFGRDAARAVFAILRHVAPTLEVLYIHVNEYVTRELNESGLELPRLVDLTTCTGFPLIQPQPSRSGRVECALVPCPTLRRLHIVETNEMWCDTSTFLGAQGITHFAPNLVSLRLSELGQDEDTAVDVASSMRFDIGVPGIARQSIVPLPENVEQVVLKPTSEPDPECCDGYDETYIYHDLVRYARRLAQKSERVVLLQADKEAPERDYLLREWLDKANGRLWMWDVKDSLGIIVIHLSAISRDGHKSVMKGIYYTIVF